MLVQWHEVEATLQIFPVVLYIIYTRRLSLKEGRWFMWAREDLTDHLCTPLPFSVHHVLTNVNVQLLVLWNNKYFILAFIHFNLDFKFFVLMCVLVYPHQHKAEIRTIAILLMITSFGSKCWHFPQYTLLQAFSGGVNCKYILLKFVIITIFHCRNLALMSRAPGLRRARLSSKVRWRDVKLYPNKQKTKVLLGLKKMKQLFGAGWTKWVAVQQ